VALSRSDSLFLEPEVWLLVNMLFLNLISLVYKSDYCESFRYSAITSALNASLKLAKVILNVYYPRYFL